MLTFKIEDNASKIANGFREKVAGILNNAAMRNRDVSRALAPKGTGELADSIEVQPVDIAQKKLTAKVLVKAEYAKEVELGTVKNPPQPFLLPGFEQARKEALDELGKVIKE